MSTASLPWVALCAPDGSPVARYLADSRPDGRPWADVVTPLPGSDAREVAAALRREFADGVVSVPPMVGALLDGPGVRLLRHAHVLTRPSSTGPARIPIDPALSLLPVQTGGWPVDPARAIDGWLRAYGPDHPDHVAGSPEDVIAEFTSVVTGALGPVMAGSALALDTAGRVVAGIVVCDRPYPDGSPGEPPLAGPWVADVWRTPDAPRGVGTALLARACEAVADSGGAAVSLAVTHANGPARRAYARLGFIEAVESMTLDLGDSGPAAGSPADRRDDDDHVEDPDG